MGDGSAAPETETGLCCADSREAVTGISQTHRSDIRFVQSTLHNLMNLTGHMENILSYIHVLGKVPFLITGKCFI